MAVFPDRIVLKNSADDNATIIAAIQAGGDDAITQGEIVLGILNNDVRIYTKAGDGSIVSIAGTVPPPVIISNSAPALDNDGNAVQDGDLWWRSTTGDFYVRYLNAWVEISTGGGGGSGGGGGGRGDGGDYDTGEVGSGFVFGVYGGGDFDAAGTSSQAVAPFAHAYITVDNVASVTSHTGMSSAAHVYSAGTSSYIDFTFDAARSNTDYSVLHSGESGWNVLEVSNKTTSGFRVSFYDEATGNFLSSAGVGIGAPVITVYDSDPTLTLPASNGVDEPIEFSTAEAPDGGDFT